MIRKPLTPAEKLRQTFDLFEVGVRLMRQNLRRDHPEESRREIDDRLRAWLRQRPGDSPGRPVDLSARR